MPSFDLSWRTIRPAEGFYNSEIHTPRRLPVRTFLPTGYEPNYAYPLLVFFHGLNSSEEQILRLAPRLSRRSYICIGLRGPQLLGARADGRLGYGWGPTARMTRWSRTMCWAPSNRPAAVITCIPNESIWRAFAKEPTLPTAWA